jgi:hypothetical protein
MKSNNSQGGTEFNANQQRAPGGATQRKKAGRHSPATVQLRSVEPWPEPVDGAWLLDALVRELERFLVFPKWAAATIALWILHTYAFRLREVTTYMGIESPERECGKSTLVTVLSKFVDRAAISSNISPSAFFHVIEELQPTLFIDESDTNLRGKHDLLGILNAGYTKATAFVWRMAYDRAPEEDDGQEAETGAGKSGRAVRFSCWCPKAIASIGHLPSTLASRCIVFQMQRKMEQELCERLKALDGTDLQRMCVRFVLDHGVEIAKAEPEIPVGLSNRAADIWEPLFVLGDLAGGHWPVTARQAAIGLTARSQEESPVGALLLDIYMSFVGQNRERMFSREVVQALMAYEGRPWVDLTRGKLMSEQWLAKQLAPYGIKPKNMRIGDALAKGYVLADLMETFRRYIPKSALERLKAEVAERRALLDETEGKEVKPPQEGTEGWTGAGDGI